MAPTPTTVVIPPALPPLPKAPVVAPPPPAKDGGGFSWSTLLEGLSGAPAALIGTGHNPITAVESSAVSFAHLVADITNPNWWVRVAEFLVGGTLIIIGVGGMIGAGKAVRSGTRTTERAARVGYSVTPTGSAVNRASRAVARTSRRARS